MRGRFLLGLIVSAAFIAGCTQSDAALTAAVKAKLVADDQVRAHNINVDTSQRVVTLTGTVHSPAEENHALEIARNTNGVADVIDKLSVETVSEPGSAATTGTDSVATEVRRQVNDGTIRSDIKARLLADPVLNGTELDVDVRDRIATLSGVVMSPEEKSRALEVAGKADGVARIEDNVLVRETPRPTER